MSLEKNKYEIVRNAIDKGLALFIYNYFHMQKQVYDTCMKTRYLSPYEYILGFYDEERPHCLHTYASYGDIAMETLLLKLQPLLEKRTGLKLIPSYSYARIYKKGDVLQRHKDRFSCEISTTMYLGGDEWPIYLEPSGKTHMKGIKINLKAGDMLIYRGRELEHWREEFKGNNCVQVFLHYNNIKTPGAEKNSFDTRPHLGLPPWFKRKNE